MKIIFCISIVWLIYVYIGYPIALAALALRKRVRPMLAENKLPSVAVLIAARNEEGDIGWKVTETLEWDYPQDKLRVLVASDASGDGTDEILYRCSDRRLLFVRMQQRGGKVRALNRLVELANPEILFFTDANAHIGPRALRLMVRHFADPRIGCVTGESSSAEDPKASASSNSAGLYRRYESLVRHLESNIGSVLVCDGAIFAIRSELYQTLSADLANDVELPLRVAAAGYCVTCEPRALVSEKDTSSPFEEFQRQRRICAQGMLALLNLPGVFGGMRGWQFVSHKLLRWLSLVPMMVMLIVSAMLAKNSVPFALLSGLQIIFYGSAGVGIASAYGGRHIPRLAGLPLYVVVGFLAALLGVIDTLFGRRFDIWEIPSLSRGSLPDGAVPPMESGD